MISLFSPLFLFLSSKEHSHKPLPLLHCYVSSLWFSLSVCFCVFSSTCISCRIVYEHSFYSNNIPSSSLLSSNPILPFSILFVSFCQLSFLSRGRKCLTLLSKEKDSLSHLLRPKSLLELSSLIPQMLRRLDMCVESLPAHWSSFSSPASVRSNYCLGLFQCRVS